LLTSSCFRYSQELISSITVTNPTHINLSNKSFDNGAAEKVAEYVRSLEGVTVADISDIIAGRPEDEALRTLSIICSSLKKFKLTEVNLSDNALGAKGVDACKDILLGSDLEVSHGNRWSALGTNSLLFNFFTPAAARVQQRAVCGGWGATREDPAPRGRVRNRRSEGSFTETLSLLQ
jgi:hypothetical protein